MFNYFGYELRIAYLLFIPLASFTNITVVSIGGYLKHLWKHSF